MFCWSCGWEITDYEQFCKFCGASVYDAYVSNTSARNGTGKNCVVTNIVLDNKQMILKRGEMLCGMGIA